MRRVSVRRVRAWTGCRLSRRYD